MIDKIFFKVIPGGVKHAGGQPLVDARARAAHRAQRDPDEWSRRVDDVEWRDVPSGFYAIPIDNGSYNDGYRVFGYRMYERRRPRTYNNGRTVGKDRWISRAIRAGCTREEFEAIIGNWHEHALPYADRERDDIAEILDDPDFYRTEFGRFTGYCGSCGKELTDPNSRIRGIGPECIKRLR